MKINKKLKFIFCKINLIKIYTIFLFFAQPFILLNLFFKSIKNPDYRKRLKERYGFCDKKVKQNCIIIHAVSVGETLSTINIVKNLYINYPNIPIVFTTITPSGSKCVKKFFGNNVYHVYFPYDHPSAINRFLFFTKPKLIILIEKELWPNFIQIVHKKNIPIIIANAGISKFSKNRYKKLKFINILLNKITLVAAQDKENANRFLQLGLNPSKLIILGNLKFDIIITSYIKNIINKIKKKVVAQKRLIWIASSTHKGEENFIFYVYSKLLNIFPNLLLILVPRNIHRCNNIFKKAKKYGFSSIIESNIFINLSFQVIISNTIGKLKILYGIADIAFIGGSLINHGGHNPLEAAIYSIPIITGPFIYNFNNIYKKLKIKKGVIIVKNKDFLYEEIKNLLYFKKNRKIYGENAKKVLLKNKGASYKLISLISPYLR